MTVAAGTEVEWTFGHSPFPHNVTFDDGTASPNLAKGTWSRRFTEPGTYTYRCSIHPFMIASVTVTPEDTSARSAGGPRLNVSSSFRLRWRDTRRGR